MEEGQIRALALKLAIKSYGENNVYIPNLEDRANQFYNYITTGHMR